MSDDPILPAATRLGAIHLNARDPRALADFYVRALGLSVQREADGVLALGCGGPDLLVLSRSPGPWRPVATPPCTTTAWRSSGARPWAGGCAASWTRAWSCRAWWTTAWRRRSTSRTRRTTASS